MAANPVRVERRVGQRFSYLLPVSLLQKAGFVEGVGFTQDLSSKGVFFFTDAALEVGAEIELTLRMPSEITLGENMPVRCRGRILRIVRPTADGRTTGGAGIKIAETKIGVAVRLECYEYLAEVAAASCSYPRVSSLHPQQEDDGPLAHSSARSLL